MPALHVFMWSYNIITFFILLNMFLVDPPPDTYRSRKPATLTLSPDPNTLAFILHNISSVSSAGGQIGFSEVWRVDLGAIWGWSSRMRGC